MVSVAKFVYFDAKNMCANYGTNVHLHNSRGALERCSPRLQRCSGARGAYDFQYDVLVACIEDWFPLSKEIIARHAAELEPLLNAI